MWVKPTATSTYIVRQEICGLVKWDTVVVYENPVGIDKLRVIGENLKIYPVPSKDHVVLDIGRFEAPEFNELKITNCVGQILREEELKFDKGIARISLEDLPSGAYTITISNLNNESITKKLIIAK